MLIIGIAGGTGSGKTTVVNQMVSELPTGEVCVISQDSYYKDTTQLSIYDRIAINFDHPNAVDFQLLAHHLSELKKGNAFEQPVYSFVEHNRTDKTVTTHPKKVVIVEGILILTQPEVRTLFDMKVYVHADSDERLIRRLKRDIAERGRDVNEVLHRYQTTLKPMHKQFIEPTKEYADIIIPTNKNNKVGVAMLKNMIHQKLQ